MGAGSSKKPVSEGPTRPQAPRSSSSSASKPPLHRGDSTEQIRGTVKEKPSPGGKYALGAAGTGGNTADSDGSSSYYDVNDTSSPRASPVGQKTSNTSRASPVGRSDHTGKNTSSLPRVKASPGQEDGLDEAVAFASVVPVGLGKLTAVSGSNNPPPSPPRKPETTSAAAPSRGNGVPETTTTAVPSLSSDGIPPAPTPLPSGLPLPDFTSPRPTPPTGSLHHTMGSRVVNPSAPSINEEDAAGRIQRLLRNKTHRAKAKRMHEWKVTYKLYDIRII